MILLVDDDPQFLDEAFAALPATARVYMAGDAQHATNVLRQVGGRLSIALVDLDLPGTSGFDLIREMQQMDSTLPLIAISGVLADSALESARVFGACETLRKPVTPAWNAIIERLQRKEALRANATMAARASAAEQPASDISCKVGHRAGTGHFRCLCGARLTFATDSAIYTRLDRVHKGQHSKTGVCPSCGITHVMRWT
jgi:DNA-binding NtrC family response regulator